MTGRELIKLLEGQDLDAPLSFQFTTTDGDGDKEVEIHPTSGCGIEEDYDVDDEGQITETRTRFEGCEIIRGFCAKRAGYEQHFVNQEGLDQWMEQHGRGRSVDANGWVPAIRIHLKPSTHW